MAATHTFFADESGNAGINYLDSDQPFHVAAGFLIANQHLPAAEAAIRAAFPPEKGEIKGSRLLRSPIGQRRAVKVIDSMAEARAMPFFVIMERRFSIAGKLVDVFLDPMHQDAVDWLPTSAIAERGAISETLMALIPEETLDLFASEYRRPTTEGFQRVLSAVINRLKAEGDSRLAQAFDGALRHVDTIVEQETYGDTPGEHGNWAALNLPAFMHLLRNVDTAMDACGRYHVVHDRVDQFEHLFTLNANKYRAPGAKQVDYEFADGQLHRMLFRNLVSFTMADSENTPMLQAADVLASTVARVLREIVAGWSDPTDALKRLLMLTMPALYESGDIPVSLGGIYASPTTQGAILEALMQTAREIDPSK